MGVVGDHNNDDIANDNNNHVHANDIHLQFNRPTLGAWGSPRKNQTAMPLMIILAIYRFVRRCEYLLGVS